MYNRKQICYELLFGIARSQNVLLTEISKSLEECTKLINIFD